MTTETVRQQVRIKNRTEHREPPLLWVELLETDENYIEVPIPLTHTEYSTTMERELENLESGDVVKMRFVSVHEHNLAWVCSEITTEDDEILATQSFEYTKP